MSAALAAASARRDRRAHRPTRRSPRLGQPSSAQSRPRPPRRRPGIGHTAASAIASFDPVEQLVAGRLTPGRHRLADEANVALEHDQVLAADSVRDDSSTAGARLSAASATTTPRAIDDSSSRPTPGRASDEAERFFEGARRSRVSAPRWSDLSPVGLAMVNEV